jgi:hypothetical protein
MEDKPIKIKLVSNGNVSKVMVGDKELFGVTDIKFEHSNLPNNAELMLKIINFDVELNLPADMVTIDEINKKIARGN